MRAPRRRSSSLILIAFSVLLVGITADGAAQPGADRTLDLERILLPGRTVWLTDFTGHEAKARIVRIADGVVTTAGSGRTLPLDEVRLVRARVTDSLLDGALLGAASGVATGLLICTRTEPWTNCRDDLAPLLGFGALGAAAGVAVDALLRDRRTIFDAGPRGPQLEAAPLAGRDRLGVTIALRF